MSEKFIEIKDGIYVVTDGKFKIMKGKFTEEGLKEIYQLVKKIEIIKEEKKYYEKEIENVQNMKNNTKNAWMMRVIPVLTFFICLNTSGISSSLFGTIFLFSLCTGLEILVEKAIKAICGTKKEREEREKSATTMLESLNHHLKVHEKTLEEIKEKTQYKEISYEGDTIVKPFFDELDNKPEKMEDSNKSQNNVSLLNQVNENDRKFDFGTIISNSGRWVGFEYIPDDYPSKLIHEYSCTNETDVTIEMGVLYRHLEDDEDEITQEQSGPVKKLTPPKNTKSK